MINSHNLTICVACIFAGRRADGGSLPLLKESDTERNIAE